MKKARTTFKAGQYYAAQYNGNNGDLIVGRVKSVRTTGEVILTNLLSGKISVKKAEVLARRNKRISNAQADELAQTYVATKYNKAAVRKAAVAMKPFADKESKTPVRPKTDTDGNLHNSFLSWPKTNSEEMICALVDSYYNDLRIYAQKRTNQFIAAVVALIVKRGGRV